MKYTVIVSSHMLNLHLRTCCIIDNRYTLLYNAILIYQFKINFIFLLSR